MEIHKKTGGSLGITIAGLVKTDTGGACLYECSVDITNLDTMHKVYWSA